MNRFASQQWGFFLITTFLVGFFISDVQHARAIATCAFDKQIKGFADGGAFVAGMRDQVNYLMKGVEQLKHVHRAQPSESDGQCLSHEAVQLHALHDFLQKNHDAIAADFDAQCFSSWFGKGKLEEFVGKLKKLEALDNAFCRGSVSVSASLRDDLKQLYAAHDQCQNIKGIQVKQMDAVLADREHAQSPLGDATPNNNAQAKNQAPIIMSKTWWRSPIAILGGVIVGGALTFNLMRNKIIAFLYEGESRNESSVTASAVDAADTEKLLRELERRLQEQLVLLTAENQSSQ